MPKYTQATRHMAISTPLGDDKLLLVRFRAVEQLGRLFEFEAECQSEQLKIDFNKLVGQNVTVRVEQTGTLKAAGAEPQRYFNGFVSRVTQTGYWGALAQYRLTIVPQMWFLTRASNCRIFQKISVPDLIEKILTDNGMEKPERGLSATYAKREYVVQYRETDFNFISRLMEEEGISYFFKHENGKHTVVLADSAAASKDTPGYGMIPFVPVHEDKSRGETIQEIIIEQEVQPGEYAVNDFDFTKVNTKLLAKAQIGRSHEQSKFAMFDYPGEYDKQPDGQALAKVRLEELQVGHEVIRGRGDARGIVVGGTMKVVEHDALDDKQLLVTGTVIHAETDEYGSQNAGATAARNYSVAFTAMRTELGSFRPARITPRPIIAGPQTAIVVGKAGLEIDTDEWGRVKLQFHWDRYSKGDENSSCWVRVSQAWAGKKWGWMSIPRIGQEVIVEFLEGDPDRPIVTGRVYNNENPPPYDPKSMPTITTFKSSTSKGGSGFNELRFEDKKGEEQIFIHAEKNLDIRVKNDRFETIGDDRHLHVKNKKFEKVDADSHVTIGGNLFVKIGTDLHEKVDKKEAREVAESKSLKVSGDVIEEFMQNQSTVVKSNHYLKADNIVIEGLTNVTVKVGQSYIAIESGGIKIGTTGNIELESTGDTKVKATGNFKAEATANAEIKGTAGAKIESTATCDVKGMVTNVKADTALTVKGAITNVG